MFSLILLLILFLPGALLPLALKTLFSSNELDEMGVYTEDLESIPSTQKKPIDTSRSGPSCLITSLST